MVPGVGAFAACMTGLLAVGGDEVIAKRRVAGRPTLAICVGHQVLFSAGIEHGVRAEGCAVWPGVVEQLDAERLPHMGWNTVQAGLDSRLFAGIATERFYFVHSYARPRPGAGAGPDDHLGRARRGPLRRRGGGGAAGLDPVPPGEVRGRRGPADRQLADDPLARLSSSGRCCSSWRRFRRAGRDCGPLHQIADRAHQLASGTAAVTPVVPARTAVGRWPRPPWPGWSCWPGAPAEWSGSPPSPDGP